MRHSVSSPDETPRRELKNTTRSGVFLTNFEVFHLLMKQCRILDITTVPKQNDFRRKNQGCNNEQFSSDFQTLININLLCIFFMNY